MCEGGGLCLGVCHGMEIGGHRVRVGSVLPPQVLMRLELRLRPAWQAQLPANVSLQSIDLC